MIEVLAEAPLAYRGPRSSFVALMMLMSASSLRVEPSRRTLGPPGPSELRLERRAAAGRARRGRASRDGPPGGAPPSMPGVGERAPFVAEQLGLEQVLGDGGAVDLDELRLRSRAAPVDDAGEPTLFPVPVSPVIKIGGSLPAPARAREEPEIADEARPSSGCGRSTRSRVHGETIIGRLARLNPVPEAPGHGADTAKVPDRSAPVLTLRVPSAYIRRDRATPESCRRTCGSSLATLPTRRGSPRGGRPSRLTGSPAHLSPDRRRSRRGSVRLDPGPGPGLQLEHFQGQELFLLLTRAPLGRGVLKKHILGFESLSGMKVKWETLPEIQARQSSPSGGPRTPADRRVLHLAPRREEAVLEGGWSHPMNKFLQDPSFTSPDFDSNDSARRAGRRHQPDGSISALAAFIDANVLFYGRISSPRRISRRPRRSPSWSSSCQSSTRRPAPTASSCAGSRTRMRRSTRASCSRWAGRI